MKKTMSISTAIVSTLAVLSLATPAFAQSYQCVLPASPPSEIKKIPHGNWGPQHNTNKWYYAPINGVDIYRHKNPKRNATVGTKCKGLGYDYGTRRTDYNGGLQDYCVKTYPGHPQRTGVPTCPTGYSLSSDYGTCTRPAKSGYWKKTRKPRGNWGPQHNTNKWYYAAVNGADIYRHKNPKRSATVGTKCKGLGYNFGTLKKDLVGNQDWCANWVAPVSASTIKADCSSLGSGFSLQLKSSGNTGTTTGGKPKPVKPIKVAPMVKKKMKALPPRQ